MANGKALFFSRPQNCGGGPNHLEKHPNFRSSKPTQLVSKFYEQSSNPTTSFWIHLSYNIFLVEYFLAAAKKIPRGLGSI